MQNRKLRTKERVFGGAIGFGFLFTIYNLLKVEIISMPFTFSTISAPIVMICFGVLLDYVEMGRGLFLAAIGLSVFMLVIRCGWKLLEKL